MLIKYVFLLTMSKESSLVRHVKRCMSDRPPSLRRKSCRQCSIAKVRCDLHRPGCSRCILRKETCNYLQGSRRDQLGARKPQSPLNTDAVTDVQQQTTLDSDLEPLTTVLFSSDDPLSNGLQQGFDSVNARLDLLDRTPENATSYPTSATTPTIDLISDQWLMSMIPTTDTTPILAKHSMEVLLRVIGSWPRMMAKEFQLPPIIHTSQISGKVLPLPLANCFTITKMWHSQCHGSSNIVRDTVMKEMTTLFENVKHSKSPVFPWLT